MKVAADQDTPTTEEPTLAGAVHRRVDEPPPPERIGYGDQALASNSS